MTTRFKNRAFAGLLLGLCAAGAVTAPADAQVIGPINGGNGSTWRFRNNFITTNGQATGFASLTPEPSGVSLMDAELPGQSDAFDEAMAIFVNNSVYMGGSGLAQNGQFVTGGTVNTAGLNVFVEYYVDTTSPTARARVVLANPTASLISVPVQIANNVGSDTFTQVFSTSSGDGAFTTADRWVVTDEFDEPSAFDPAITHVLFGPGAVAETPTGVATTAFFQSGNNAGILGSFNLEVEAGATESLVFFTRLSSSAFNAQTGTFNSNDAMLNSTLLAGLTPTDLAQVQNWSFGAVAPGVAAPEPGTFGLLGLGLVGFVAARRRRKAATR